MSTLDDLLARPVDHERRRGRSLPWPVLFGTLLPITTPCGTVSRCAQQCADAVRSARYRAPATVEHLTDADVLWLLVMGWAP